nr:unnamed protein product [Spirometra erinaceieuropaei]
MNGAHLQVLNSFIYLGSTPFRTTKIDDEVAYRISKVSQAFGRLQSTVRNRHGLDLGTKLKMCKVVILPTPLYVAETWMVCKKEARRLNHFYLSRFRRILKLKWRDRIPDMNVLERMGIAGICAMLRQLKLTWSGHLVRMDDKRLPKILFYGDVATGLHRQVDRVRRYKDVPKTSLRRLQINPTNWEDIARDRPTWWSAVETDAAIYETNRTTASKAKRKARRPQIPSPHNVNNQPPPTCSRRRGHSGAPISLIRHLQTNCNTRTAPHDAPPQTSASPPRRQSTLAALLNPHRYPSPQHPLRRLLHPPPLHSIQTTAKPTTTKVRDLNSAHACPHCDRIFTSHIGMIGHLRIHRTQAGEQVLGALTNTLHPPKRPSLHPRTHSPHGPSRLRAYPRERYSLQPRNTQCILHIHYV